MDNGNSSAVASLNDKREQAIALVELDGASRMLGINSLSWDLGTQQVLRVAGLTANEHLLKDNVAPGAGSPAELLGHRTLRALVEGSKKDNGLELDWTEFQAKMTALVYRQKYNLTENDYQEINALFDDATQILGRAPSDSAEFHGAKQRALAERVDQLVGENHRQQAEYDRKTSSLQQELTRKTGEAEQARGEAQRVSADAVRSIQEMRRDSARLQEETEVRADARVEEARKEASIETQRKLTELRDSLQASITQAEAQRQAAEGELKELQRRIAAGEYVTKATLEEINNKLGQLRLSEVNMRNDLLAVNEQLTAEKLVSAGLREEVTRLQDARIQDREQITTLETRLSTIIEDRTQTTEFAIMHERLTNNRDTIAELTTQLDTERSRSHKLEGKLNSVRGSYKQLHTSGRQYCDSLKTQITELQVEKNAVTRDLSQIKVVLAVTLTCGTLAAIAFGLKHLGFF